MKKELFGSNDQENWSLIYTLTKEGYKTAGGNMTGPTKAHSPLEKYNFYRTVERNEQGEVINLVEGPVGQEDLK